MLFRKARLPNRLRLILVPNRKTQAVTVLALITAGSRYESQRVNGISHFLEHLVFKGTRKWPSALALMEVLDSVGGIYNAYTDKEYTGFFAKVNKRHLERAVEWIADLILNPLLREEDLEKEKKVIIEEIKMYLDTPVRYIHDLWELLLYRQQPLGWLILGSTENIEKIKKRDIIDYYFQHYSAEKIVLTVSGNFREKEILSLIKKYFSGLKKGKRKEIRKTKEKQKKPELLIHYKETDQTHFCLGVRAYDLFHKDRYAVELLAVILGGNMSSRLFTEVREKKGLAYYIQTSTGMYRDAGYLVTQTGVAHENLEKTVQIILENYQKIKNQGVPKKELKKAKDYLQGIFSLSLETSDAQANFFGRQEILTNKIETLEEKLQKIERITESDIQRVARDIFQRSKLNLAIIGPFKNKKQFTKILSL